MTVSSDLVARFREAMKGVTPGPYQARLSKMPVDGEFDCAIATNVNGAPAVVAECFGRVSEFGRLDAAKNGEWFALCSPENIASLLDALAASQAREAEAYERAAKCAEECWLTLAMADPASAQEQINVCREEIAAAIRALTGEVDDAR